MFIKKMIESRYYLFLIVILLSGCSAGFKEGCRGFMGVSTKELEVKRPEAIKKTFDQDINVSIEKTKEILTIISAYIYKEDKTNNLIAIYVSQTDTTPVGIFFTRIDKNKTQIEVSSPSKYGKETIAKKLFPALEDPKQLELLKQKASIEEEPISTELPF